MTLDAESLYRQLGRHLESIPDLLAYPLPREAQLWLGRAGALVEQSSSLNEKAAWRVTMMMFNIGDRGQKAEEAKRILYQVLAIAELEAPPGVKGTFIPAGSSFDAFAALSKVMQTATRDVFIVDPYMDQAALTDFGLAVPTGVNLRLLADEKDHKPSLQPAKARVLWRFGWRRRVHSMTAQSSSTALPSHNLSLRFRSAHTLRSFALTIPPR